MIVDNQIVSVRVKTNLSQWYSSKGYKCNSGDIINVNPKDLPLGSNKYVLVICDYCKNVFEQSYNSFNRGHKNIDKDACSKCRHLKTEESTFIKYGMNLFLRLENLQNKKI